MPKQPSLIKTLKKAGLDAKEDILTPLTHGSGVGKFATEVDEATILTASWSHDLGVIGEANEWLDGIDHDDLGDVSWNDFGVRVYNYVSFRH